MSKQPIQTLLQLEFDGVNISADLLPDLLSFEYEDKETGEADEIAVSLKDEDGRWAGTWRPDGGETVRAWIIGGRTDGIGEEIYCGKFYVDSLTAAGSPRTMEIRAVSIPMNTPIRKKLKSRSWEKQSVSDIARAIASDNGVSFQLHGQDVKIDKQKQDRESDMQFLLRVCEEVGYSLKVTDDALVIFDPGEYEKASPVRTYTLGVSDILSWSFESAQSETYKSCKVTYRDPKKKQKKKAGKYDFIGASGGASGENPAVSTYTYVDPDVSDQGQEYTLKARAPSIEDAKRLARAKLRELNKRSVTGSMSLVGDVGLVAGVVVAVKGFGSFDGNFIVESASHTVDGGGYKTSVNLRRVNNRY